MTDDDDAEEAERLAGIKARLAESRAELHWTIRAIQQKRRTPDQIRAVIDRSRRTVYKSILLKRKWDWIKRVH